MFALKKIGSSGQITLGKEYAGRQVMVEQPEPGVWIIKTGKFVPDSEKWLHDHKATQKLDKAIDWAENNVPAETNLSDLEKRIREK